MGVTNEVRVRGFFSYDVNPLRSSLIMGEKDQQTGLTAFKLLLDYS